MTLDATPSAAPDVRVCDTTLRDGSHAVAHQFTEEQVRMIVRGLDAAGVALIEVTHGDGLAGSSINFGFSGTPELTLIAAAAEEARRARIAALLLPGIGTVEDLRAAVDAGIEVVRIATHCTEADIAAQHFSIARELGLETVGFLMLAHMIDPSALAEQARIMVDAGCQCVYVVDSAGALLLSEAQARFRALVNRIGPEAQVGYHGHNNLALGIANSVLAVREGARQIDGALCALGAGAGNSPTEILAAVFDREGIKTGIDLPTILDVADEIVRPMLPRLPVADRNAITMGHAGVYSSFLLHAERAAARYGVPAHDILREVGARGYVGGQEDMIIDIAVRLAERAGSALGDGADRDA